MVECREVLLFPRRAKRRGGSPWCRRRAASASQQARAVDADVGELVEMRHGDIERLAAAHREPGDGAMRPVGHHAIVLLHVRHDVADKISDELVARGSPARCRRAAPAAARVGVAGRHHDDHRLRLARRDQVVEDEVRPAHRGPRVVAVAGAVQQVEDRVFARARFIARRRVDVHAPGAPERGGLVVHRRDGTVRHGLRVHQVRSRHRGDAPRRGVRFTDRRVPRIDHADAVHDEHVSIRARLDDARRQFPDAVGPLDELRVGSRRRGNIPAAQPHRRRVRRVEAKRNPSIS